MTTTKTYKDLKKIPAAALPRKLSETIRVALTDLASVERSPRFIVDMGTWFQRSDPEDRQTPCEVCFAGSVMARTLGVSFKILSERTANPEFPTSPYMRGGVTPEAFKQSIRRKLAALNRVREYNVVGAAESFYGKDSRAHTKLVNAIESYEISFPTGTNPSYEIDRDAWGHNMAKIADRLEAIGL